MRNDKRERGLFHGRCGQGPVRGGRGPGGRGGDVAQDHDMLARQRKFSARALQLVFLGLLAEKPRHGYELIKDIAQRSLGYYAPSPGVVYPALTFLEETGLVEVESAGPRKCYRLSPQGVAHLAAEEEEFRLQWARLAHLGKKMEAMRRAMSGDADESGWLPEYVDARRGLKRVLLLKSEVDATEQRRIAAILRHAIEAIEAGGENGHA